MTFNKYINLFNDENNENVITELYVNVSISF